MIELKNVRQTHWNSNMGLIDANAVIPSGEIVGILGENGSGKTTLLKTIMGLKEIWEGEILINGKPVAEEYENIAFITEEGSYFPYMTPGQYGAFLAEFFPKFQRERYAKLLDFFELPTQEKIRNFSRGQKSKLEIAAGFAKGAQIILMDEPFLGKDVFARRDFLKLMLSSLRQDETILIATHLLDEIEHVIDRAWVLFRARIHVDVYMDELREKGGDLMSVMSEFVRYDEEEYKTVFDESR